MRRGKSGHSYTWRRITKRWILPTGLLASSGASSSQYHFQGLLFFCIYKRIFVKTNILNRPVYKHAYLISRKESFVTNIYFNCIRQNIINLHNFFLQKSQRTVYLLFIVDFWQIVATFIPLHLRKIRV